MRPVNYDRALNAQLVPYMAGGRWARAGEAVGAGGGQWRTALAYDFERDQVGGHADRDRVVSAGHDIRDFRALGSTTVSGPGQNASISRHAFSGTSVARRFNCSGSAIWAISGL